MMNNKITVRTLTLSIIVALAAAALSTQAFSVPGITEPVTDEILSSTVAGKIESIHFEEGDSVKEGDIVIDLEKTMEQLEVERRKLIWESKVEVESAAARVETFRADYDGTKRLYDTTKSVSKDELDKKKLELTLAEADLKNLEIVELREEIEYRMAEEQLKRRSIKAPTTGIVTEIFLEEGENCETNQPLIRIVDIKECHFVCHVDLKTAPPLKLGQNVTLAIDQGRSELSVDGKISFISPVVDPASGLQEVKALFKNKKGKINPGVAGKLTIK